MTTDDHARSSVQQVVLRRGEITTDAGSGVPLGVGGLPPVLDVCCGGKAMWFDRQDGRALYLDRRRETVTEILPGRNQEVVINPDMLACFTDLPFPDNSFALVVMDPPHVQREEMLGNITKRYGCLNGDWREMLRKGFSECFRVLRPEGTLIFKWSSVQFALKDILPLALPHKPLFGHQSGKRMNTHWVAFLKPLAPASEECVSELPKGSSNNT
jgi:SAM-dependent methyltransferase